MEKYRKILLTAVIFVLMGMIASAKGFVTVSDGRFILDGKPYKYVGTNMWQATIMASEGRGGNRAKLLRELDHLKRMGINNIRILVGAEGPEGLDSHIKPVLQTAPGVYNDTILRGLDFLLVEMEKRDLRGVFYLTNSWEWSGGYSVYLQWAGFGDAKIPRVDGYEAYVDYVKQFVQSDSAKAMYYRHIRHIVGRTNSITGKPYSESPAVMSWQIANEPRPFSKAGLSAFYDFLLTSARIIKSIDRNHLVSTGSEGLVGFEMSLDWWTKLHAASEIDYANIHIWPCTWRWVTRENVFTAVDKACADSRSYIKEHYDAISPYGKPLVLEEFGYHRDAFSFTPGSPTKARDQYYKYILDILTDTPMLAGCNFWTWSGDARPSHLWWQEWDDFCGDPAQEEQGLYSVFTADKSTLKIIKKATARLH